MLTLIRGNTKHYAVTPKVNGTAYTLQANEKVYFCIKSCEAAEAAKVVEKTLTNADYNTAGQLVMNINPADTAALEAGKYKFDFAIEFQNGEFYTFIENDDFIIKPALCEKAVSVGG